MTPQIKQLITLAGQLLDLPSVNALRHTHADVDELGCRIEKAMAALGLFVEDSDGNTVLSFAAAALGQKGGSVISETKATAARINGRKSTSGGRPRQADAKPESVKRREYRAKKKAGFQ